MAEIELTTASEDRRRGIREAIGIDAQGASGYLDIGDVRIQWGSEPGTGANGTITFPAPFADASYGITGTAGRSTSLSFSLTFAFPSATGVNYSKRWINGSGIGNAGPESFSWTAIGRRPE